VYVALRASLQIGIADLHNARWYFNGK